MSQDPRIIGTSRVVNWSEFLTGFYIKYFADNFKFLFINECTHLYGFVKLCRTGPAPCSSWSRSSLTSIYSYRCLRLRSAAPSPVSSSSRASTTRSRIVRSGNEPRSTSRKNNSLPRFVVLGRKYSFSIGCRLTYVTKYFYFPVRRAIAEAYSESIKIFDQISQV